MSNVVKTRVHRVLTSMLKIQNNVSAIVSQKDPKFVGDMISAKICQKIIILSAIWFRRKSEEGSDACNTDCGNRVESKQRSVTAWSTVQTEFCRYKWLIRPLIHRNAIASLDWIGKSAPVPPANINRFPVKVTRQESRKFYICSDVTHTRGIDCTWKKIKDKLPPGIHTRKKGKINKDQQSTAGTACCERTAKQLKSKGRCEGRK